MSRNYDTTNHKPYPRVSRLEIDYATDGTPNVQYVEQMAIVDGAGKVRHIEGTASRHVLDPSILAAPAQVVDPDTGVPIEGETVTTNQLMLGLLAYLRADQVQRDKNS